MKLAGVALLFIVGAVGCATNPGPDASPVTPEPSGVAESAAPTEANGDSNEAVADAVRLHEAGQYEEAADAFARAHAEGPDATLVLSQAESLRLAGRCGEARVLYEQFLLMSADPTYRNAVQQLADDCVSSQPSDADSQVAQR